MYDAALQRLEAGDLRNASENAWCAAKRATSGLILERSGELTLEEPDTTRALQIMALSDPTLSNLRGRYFELLCLLHDDCYYTGLCEPVEDTERLIRETIDYIRDAERLADAAR